MNIRKTGYFILDKIKGGNVLRQLKEIRKANSDDNFSKQLVNKSLEKLINHVNETVPFYKKLKMKKFENFPVVNKVLMKEYPKEFVSSANLKIGKIRHTSGSTGMPFEILQDKIKSNRVEAECIYYRELAEDEIGNKFINLTNPSRITKSSYINEIKNNVISFDVTKMNEETFEKLHIILKKDSTIKYMLGYASALEKVADYFYEHGYIKDTGIKSIVSSSEILSEGVINKLKKIFSAKVYDRYSNEDNGFICQTNGLNHDFILNRASYYVEILKFDSDDPADENEVGRIIITDLFNYIQPFIRYDTGDIGAYSYREIEGSKKYVLTKLAGRISDIVYDENDIPVNTFAIGNALEPFYEIKQYQLIQNDKKKFVLKINGNSKNYSDEDYKKNLKDILGESINIDILHIDDIPILNSGKYKRVICNYEPEKNKEKK